MLRKLPSRKKISKNPSSTRQKKLKLIREICKTYPKIKKKIKNIKDIDKRVYYAKVWYITESQPLHTLKNFELRSFKGYHLDHICSISEGYKNNISPEIIGNIKNLQFIPWEENYKKGSKVEKTILENVIKKNRVQRKKNN
jgi:hypothetical protein